MKKYLQERIEKLEKDLKTSTSDLGKMHIHGQLFALKDILEQLRYE